MRIIVRLTFAAVAIGLIQGCTSYRPQSFHETTSTATTLSQNNYKVTQLGVQASASVDFLFPVSIGYNMVGIPLGSTDLLRQAMAEVHRQSNLEGRSAILHNINVEWDTQRFLFLTGRRRVTITADVVEFTDDWKWYGSRDFEEILRRQRQRNQQ